MCVSYTSITITSAKTRWGSCSGDNALRYTYRLLYCPKEIIDYVVVHELAHTVEHNHSKRFWQVVERYIPDWKERRKWLKAHGILMEIF
jgi:predicted metal-dependent hydrolase